jgi:Phage endonuclease I
MTEMRSGAEINCANWLGANGVEYEYETHKIPYVSVIKGGECEKCGGKAVQNRVYTPDFWLPEYKFYIEVKGRLTSSDRKKMRDVKRCNPKLDIRMLFVSNKITPSKPERYSDWSDKYGFPYSLRSVDVNWFKQ